MSTSGWDQESAPSGPTIYQRIAAWWRGRKEQPRPEPACQAAIIAVRYERGRIITLSKNHDGHEVCSCQYACMATYEKCTWVHDPPTEKEKR